MSDPALTLQKAIRDKLLASSDVVALVGQRIYDRIPNDPDYPYISIGPAQTFAEDAECIEGFEVFQQIDIWSQKPGFPEEKEIAGAARVAIHRVDLSLDGFVLVEIEHRVTRHMRDPDGLTSHGAIEFRAMIETDEET
jgi:hypothetical protein